jgi:LacI family transcriptional regulator
VTAGDFTARGGYLAAGRLLVQARLTALFVSNDPMAIGAMRRVAEWGLSVPRDFSVVGFDGIALGAYVEPGLTTVNQSTRRLGEVAAARLIERIRGERFGRSLDVVIEPKLVIRGSTAPPLGA